MITNGFDLRLSVYGVLEGEKMDKLEYALYRAKGIGKTDCSKWYEGFYSMQTDFPYGKSMNAAEKEKMQKHFLSYDEVMDFGMPSLHMRVEINPETLGKCSGCSVDGKWIFCGDIVKTQEIEGEGIVCFGRFRNPEDSEGVYHLGFYVDWKKDKNSVKDLCYWSRKHGFCVVGNIYDDAGYENMK